MNADGINERVGRIEVIAGPMFAGKTEELLRRVRRAAIAKRRVRLFTHVLDTRSGSGRAASHIGVTYPSTEVTSAAEIPSLVEPGETLICIDEAHFFGESLIDVAAELAGAGHVACVAGLDVTFEGRPFEPLTSLMSLAERVDKLTAICLVCGEDAIFHVRMKADALSPTTMSEEHVGGQDKYQARCRHHFAP